MGQFGLLSRLSSPLARRSILSVAAGRRRHTQAAEPTRAYMYFFCCCAYAGVSFPSVSATTGFQSHMDFYDFPQVRDLSQAQDFS